MLFDNPSFWFDESALGFNILELNFGELFGILHLQQIAPPLFLVCAKLLTVILGANDITIRLFPFIIGNLCMIIFWLCLNSIYKNKYTVLTGLLIFCLNIQMIKYSIEFKPYIVEVFVTCLILYIFTKINFNWSYKKLLLIGFSLSVLPWFAFISAVALSIAFAITFSTKIYKKWLTLAIPVIISLVIFVIYYLKVNSFYSKFMTDFFNDSFLTIDVLFSKLILILNFLFGIKLSILPILLIACGIIYCLIAKRTDFAFKYSVLNILACIVLSFLHKYPFFNRFVLYTFPLFLFIMLPVFERLYNLKNKFISLLLVLLLLFLMYPSARYIKKISTEKINKRNCSRVFMEYMANNIKPDDEIIVDTLSTPDFMYYNKYFKLNNVINMNIIQKDNKILYKYNKNTPLPIRKGKNYWFYSPWRSGKYYYIQYEYQAICQFGGRLLYINGDKQ